MERNTMVNSCSCVPGNIVVSDEIQHEATYKYRRHKHRLLYLIKPLSVAEEKEKRDDHHSQEKKEEYQRVSF
jgi:hypothetical protein